MKITIEIPDNTVLATVSLATSTKYDPYVRLLDVMSIRTEELKDGNTVDLRPKM